MNTRARFVACYGRVTPFHPADGVPTTFPTTASSKGLECGIRVTTRYRDPAREPHEAEWIISPLLLEDAPIRAPQGADDGRANAAAEASTGGPGEPGVAGEAEIRRRSGSPVRRRRG